MVTFNKPYLSGKELEYIKDAVSRGKISGNGYYTQKCHEFFQERYDFRKCLLTTSCTDALEMAAILCDIKPGDEVIMPSYTFVSTANAFVLRGAKIIFADSRTDHPGMDEDKIEGLITERTKAIVPVHYAGVACDMDKIMSLSAKYDLLIIEDAAQAIESNYKGRQLGSIGHFGCFSFHETKNLQCGEGGMLVINDERFLRRSEIIWEKGTNRSEFFRGEVNKYGWIDMGSSFLPSEIIAAYLYAQLENIDIIQKRRKEIWSTYFESLRPYESKGIFRLPTIPEYSENNAHMFYIVCKNEDIRDSILAYLKGKGIWAVFHYLSLHQSDYYINKHDRRILENADNYSECLIRLPFFYELKTEEMNYITNCLISFS